MADTFLGMATDSPVPVLSGTHGTESKEHSKPIQTQIMVSSEKLLALQSSVHLSNRALSKKKKKKKIKW